MRRRFVNMMILAAMAALAFGNPVMAAGNDPVTATVPFSSLSFTDQTVIWRNHEARVTWWEWYGTFESADVRVAGSFVWTFDTNCVAVFAPGQASNPDTQGKGPCIGTFKITNAMGGWEGVITKLSNQDTHLTGHGTGGLAGLNLELQGTVLWDQGFTAYTGHVSGSS